MEVVDSLLELVLDLVKGKRGCATPYEKLHIQVL